jgi:MFS family permease
MSRPDSTPPDVGPNTDRPSAVESSPTGLVTEHSVRNFGVLALFHVTLRTGWIFKVESVIIPAALDSIGGSAALRGWLPLINRFALSVPPLLFARRLRRMARKKWALFACTSCMALAFVGLAAMWWFADGAVFAWMPLVFLLLYAFFFVAMGFNQLTTGTLQGKLVRAQRRGRLLAVATIGGAVVAGSLAALLMPRWLEKDGGQFEYLFAFTGLVFLLAAAISALLAEPPDRDRRPDGPLPNPFSAAWGVLRRDGNFRRLATVALLFGTTMMAFPHYQALAREKLNLQMDSIVIWVIVQNVGTAVFSLLAGPLADRRGTRLALRVVVAGAACVPLVAVGLANLPAVGTWLYGLVFVLVGLTPITFRMFVNYTLEITGRENHPRYLSTLSLCLALPTLTSPWVGRLVDTIGFEIIFVGISVIALLSWCLTFRLIEPRHHQPSSDAEPTVLP